MDTENQVQALEKAKEEKTACGEIESYHPGFLLGQDTFICRLDQGYRKDLSADGN